MRKAIWTIWRLEIEREIGMEMGAGAGLTQGRFPHCNYGLLEYDQ